MTEALLEKTETTLVEFDTNGSTEPRLNALFRCDKGSCGAQAYVEVTLPSDGILVFCKHHAAEVKPALYPLAKTWYTEESRLIEDKKTGSEN